MTISLKTQKMLWGRAAGRCSEPRCRLDLYEDETETDDPTLIGENCHIVAESDDGPRADPTVEVERRNSYANLILLCRNHHKVIDAQEHEYTVERLLQMKKDHEAWVKSQLGYDEAKIRDDEQYASIIDRWQVLAHVDDWHAWSSNVLSSGQPELSKELDSDLLRLRTWLLNRVWPDRYPELDAAFKNFRLILQDFQETFRKHSEPFGKDGLITRKFYKIDEWDEERYAWLSNQYDFHVDLVEDLMVELSRAANLICDRIRHYLMHSYRLNEGRFVIQSGPMDDLSFHDFVVQYSPQERAQRYPYPGLPAFLIDRERRDYHFGKGSEP